jgi:hypothetical protein
MIVVELYLRKTLYFIPIVIAINALILVVFLGITRANNVALIKLNDFFIGMDYSADALLAILITIPIVTYCKR